MATIIEDYVNFETAKLLKEKGFSAPCYTCYLNKELSHYDYLSTNFELVDNAYSAPTLQMACKWLRLVYNIHISAEPWYKEDENLEDVTLSGWGYEIHNLKTNGLIHEGFEGKLYDKPEQACETAIKYCLENLI